MKKTLVISLVFFLILSTFYHNSLDGPFIFDDTVLIKDNTHIQKLWPIWDIFKHTEDTKSFSVRPLATLTYAANYALGELDPFGYHVFNIFIHFLCSIVLFLILQITLSNSVFNGAIRKNSTYLAMVSALLWMVHPLQTESVTYICQRAQSLSGLFYLLTLFFAIQSFLKDSKPLAAASIASCLLGTFSKSILVTVPFIVIFYDRFFFFESYREGFSRRYKLYLGLVIFCGLSLIFEQPVLNILEGNLGHGSSTWQYLLTQTEIISYYLQLSFWPNNLCLDYGWPLVNSIGEVIVPGIFICCLLILTIWGTYKRSPSAFLGLWFFLILAPTSSFVPIPDAAFEHYMHLPLASVITLSVLMSYYFLNKFISHDHLKKILFISLAAISIGSLGYATYQRNKDYQSAISIWTDTIIKNPLHARPHNLLGSALLEDGRLKSSIESYKKAIKLSSNYYWPHHNLGIVYEKINDLDKAIHSHQVAIKISPKRLESRSILAELYLKKQKYNDSIDQFKEIIKLSPLHMPTLNNLAWLMATYESQEQTFDRNEAVKLAQKACQLTNFQSDPCLATLAAAYAATEKFDSALETIERAIKLVPGKSNEAIGKKAHYLKLKSLFLEGKPFRFQ